MPVQDHEQEEKAGRAWNGRYVVAVAHTNGAPSELSSPGGWPHVATGTCDPTEPMRMGVM